MTVVERPPGGPPLIGRSVDRVDGPLKVTGAARYAADAPVAHALYAVLVQSTISRGRIRSIDERAARQVEDVVEIITHRNALRLVPTGFVYTIPTVFAEDGLMPLQGDEVHYWGQNVAAVVATTLEAAQGAAARLRVDYDERPADLTLDDRTRSRQERVEAFFGSPLNVERGEPDAALAAAEVAIDVTYTTPTQLHQPLETSATVALWAGDELTVYDSTQWVVGARNTLAQFFDLPPERVRVIAHFIGGGFGCKGWTWSHTVIAAMAAKMVQRPVKLVVDRTQFFTSNGHRGETEQRLRVSSTREGELTALVHDVLCVSAQVADWQEPCGSATPMLYDVPNVRVTHHTVKLDVATPTAMRAPGEAPGTFALESALDELAAAAGIDPLELRIRNHATIDRSSGHPFSSKHLLECYAEGARRFGWERRTSAPRSMRAGRELIGWGMATATYPAMAGAAEVRVRVERGAIAVECAGHDLGTGLYTIVAQTAAETLGVPLERVHVRLGDSAFPRAPVAGGSQTSASIIPVVVDACRALLDRVDGDLAAAQHGLEAMAGLPGAYDEASFSFHSFGAQFCEVRLDEELARLRVTRFVGVFDCGRILNPKTARSQLVGGIIMGLGMALMEESRRDPRSGAVVGNNFADYRVPVNADVPPIEVAFVEHPDLHFNALGLRGVGEIGITGVAAAVANAVAHASGRRVRDLPILPERLLG